MAHNFVGYLTPTPTTEVVIARSFDTWCYQVVRIQGHLLSDVSYDRSSVNGLSTFAAANREIAGQLAKEGGRARMLVYFLAPLEPDEFRRWVKENDITVDMALGDCYNCPTGGVGWVMATRDGPYIGGQSPYHETVIGLWGTANAARLPVIASSPPVFIADLTPNIIRRDLEALGSIDVESLEMVPYLEDMPIWPMRDLGLQRVEYYYYDPDKQERKP